MTAVQIRPAGRVMGRWVILHRPAEQGLGGVVLVRGRDAKDVLLRYRFKPMYSASGRGWVLDDSVLEDVVAIASMMTLGVRVTHEDGTDCRCVSLRVEGRELEIDPSEEMCSCSLPMTAETSLLGAELGAVEVGHVHRKHA